MTTATSASRGSRPRWRGLAPHDGLLIEPEHVEAVAPLVPQGLILAVDRLVQERGGAVEDTSLAALEQPPEASSR